MCVVVNSLLYLFFVVCSVTNRKMRLEIVRKILEKTTTRTTRKTDTYTTAGTLGRQAP